MRQQWNAPVAEPRTSSGISLGDLGLGTAVGAGLGSLVGVAVGDMPVGMGVGIGLGLAFAIGLDHVRRRRAR